MEGEISQEGAQGVGGKRKNLLWGAELRSNSRTSWPEDDRPPRRRSAVARIDTEVKHTFVVDADNIKARIRAQAWKPPYDVTDFYVTEGMWQRIARSQWFEYITLSVIAFNALWISIDTDMNSQVILMQAHPIFQIAEHTFCFYFSLEWFIRFKSFARKTNSLKDSWFMFDSCLVGFMVLETWVMNLLIIISGDGGGASLGNASMLRMARLLRLSRMARMARLFKVMPELLILIKAIAASLRACFFVFCLLTLLLYVFGIAFRQMADGTEVGDNYFPTVYVAMHTLWMATLWSGHTNDGTGRIINELSDESPALMAVYYLFVVLASLTVMNMLIGVLCEVVSAVAATEKESLTVAFVKGKLHDIIVNQLDADGDGQLSKEELSALLEFPEACRALADVGVDIYSLVDNIDYIFEADDDEVEEKTLTFEEFMSLILDLRGSNNATVKDMVEVQKFIKRSIDRLRDELRQGEARRSDGPRGRGQGTHHSNHSQPAGVSNGDQSPRQAGLGSRKCSRTRRGSSFLTEDSNGGRGRGDVDEVDVGLVCNGGKDPIAVFKIPNKILNHHRTGSPTLPGSMVQDADLESQTMHSLKSELSGVVREIVLPELSELFSRSQREYLLALREMRQELAMTMGGISTAQPTQTRSVGKLFTHLQSSEIPRPIGYLSESISPPRDEAMKMEEIEDVLHGPVSPKSCGDERLRCAAFTGVADQPDPERWKKSSRLFLPKKWC